MPINASIRDENGNDAYLLIYTLCQEKYATSSAPNRKAQKTYFLDLVTENNELNKCEKNYCQEIFIRNFELHNVVHKFGEPMACKNCKSIRYSVRYCELILEICNRLRLLLSQNISTSFAKIMQECWSTDSRKRPTIEELFEFANDKF
ncbi:36643_t:CDS:2, partial [Racocetra persica]